MTRNNFKIAFRVLWYDKFNTLLNLAGLAIGITCFLLMGFYVKQELSYDHFNVKKDRIYRVSRRNVNLALFTVALPLGLAIPSFYVIVGWQAASAIFHLSRVIHFWNVSDSDVVDSA